MTVCVTACVCPCVCDRVCDRETGGGHIYHLGHISFFIHFMKHEQPEPELFYEEAETGCS